MVNLKNIVVMGFNLEEKEKNTITCGEKCSNKIKTKTFNEHNVKCSNCNKINTSEIKKTFNYKFLLKIIVFILYCVFYITIMCFDILVFVVYTDIYTKFYQAILVLSILISMCVFIGMIFLIAFTYQIIFQNKYSFNIKLFVLFLPIIILFSKIVIMNIIGIVYNNHQYTFFSIHNYIHGSIIFYPLLAMLLLLITKGYLIYWRYENNYCDCFFNTSVKN